MKNQLSRIFRRIMLVLAMGTAIASVVNGEVFSGNLKLLIIRCANSDAPSDQCVLNQFPDNTIITAVSAANNFYLENSWNKVGVALIGQGSALVRGVCRIPAVTSDWYLQLYTKGIVMAQSQGHNYQNFDAVCILWNCLSDGSGDAGAQTHEHNRIYFHNCWDAGILIHELRHSLLMKAGNPGYWEACYWQAPYSIDPPPTGKVIVYGDELDMGGYQAYPGNKSLSNGAVLHWAPCSYLSYGTLLLDMRPDANNPGSSSDRTDVGLFLGKTLWDPSAGVYITPTAIYNGTLKTMDVVVATGDFVNNHVPSAQLTSSAMFVYTNQPVTFNANGSDPDNDPLAYYWEFGDGSGITQNSPAMTYAWSKPGTYGATVYVSDMKGLTTAAMQTIYVSGQPQVPAAPANLVATVVSSNRINLSWSDTSTNESGFYIQRAAGSSGPWSQLALLGANVTSYSNPGLSAGTMYWYRVYAYNNAGTSGYSNVASGSTFPDTPKGLLGDVDESGKVNIVDALKVAQYYVYLDPSPFNPALADVDCSGIINIIDALLIAQHYVGIIGPFNCK